MDTNGANVSSDADITDCDGEKVVTMMDVLQEQQDFEDDANAVLGASDEKNCTFQKGYVKRQAIYACLTCCSEAKQDETKRAGVCLACSLSCHENHDLIELYTKRNFRCDCGNPKFNSTCQFTPNKPDLNEENSYNQNFTGLYCVCHRPYPDPEAVEEDEMIQCIICEDWLHSAHLEAMVPPVEQYAEMICKTCTNKNEFLQDYIDNAVNLDEDILSDNPEPSIVNVTSITNDTDILDETNEASRLEDKCVTAMEVPDNDIITNSEQIDTKSCDEQNNANPKDETNTINSTSNEQIEDDPNTISSEIESDHHASIINSENGDNLDNTLTEDATVNTNEKNDTEIKANDNIEQKEMPTKSPNEKLDEIPSDTTIDGKEPDINDSSDKIENKESEEKTDKLINSNDDNTESTESLGETISKTTDEQTNHLSVNGNYESNKRKIEELEVDAVSKKIKLNETSDKNGCLRPKKGKKTFKGASFWPSNFRQKLCTCNECITMYKDLNVLYLIDLDDTVSAYEMLGQEKTNGTAATQYEKGLEALSSLDRVQQINALTEYNNMRDKLLDFLQSFKDRKEIVKEDDIKAFFAGMKAKREPDGVYFCR